MVARGAPERLTLKRENETATIRGRVYDVGFAIVSGISVIFGPNNFSFVGDARRIAVLGGASTDFLVAPLQLELESIGIGPTLHLAEFNTIAHEALDPNSQTVAFRPHIAFLYPTPFNITEWPSPNDDAKQVASLADKTCSHWLGLCEALHNNASCEIILANFHLLPVQAMGNLGCRFQWDRNSFIRQLNTMLARHAPAYVHIFDIDGLSSYYGVNNWFDARYWHHAKQPVSFDCMAPFVRKLAAVIGAIYGRTAKCIVLDLDNTLWGGVVGEDGVGGLKIGDGDAEGEAFKAFQEHLLQLKVRGVLLAVSSKNELQNAKAPFVEHPDMVLKLDDIAAFKANWEPKPQSIMEIANELRIGAESIIFVDDNPAERELVRQMLPEVRVLELTRDPADYPRLLQNSGWLELARFTDEDKRKAEQYAQNAQRKELEVTFTDYDGYLASLEQKAIIRAFGPVDFERVTQLINKTNQFNLTTRRMTRSEVEALAGRPDTVTACVRLADRFGDNGLISVVTGRREGDMLDIGLWLMSCRVFKRGVEFLLATHLFEKAASLGVRRIRGVYIPTTKNHIVENFYADLGFDRVESSEDGTTTWELAVERFAPAPVQIAIVEKFE